MVTPISTSSGHDTRSLDRRLLAKTQYPVRQAYFTLTRSCNISAIDEIEEGVTGCDEDGFELKNAWLDDSKSQIKRQFHPNVTSKKTKRLTRRRSSTLFTQNHEQNQLQPIGSVLPTGWHKHPHTQVAANYHSSRHLGGLREKHEATNIYVDVSSSATLPRLGARPRRESALQEMRNFQHSDARDIEKTRTQADDENRNQTTGAGNDASFSGKSENDSNAANSNSQMSLTCEGWKLLKRRHTTYGRSFTNQVKHVHSWHKKQPILKPNLIWVSQRDRPQRVRALRRM